MHEINQTWNDVWAARTVEDEIKMADFFSGRQFILKYLPRHGTSMEAGCGLGRYVFYLSDLGFQVVGTEVSSMALDKCQKWAVQNGYDSRMFRRADVRSLPYADSSFAGYISLGVIEHFEEGPATALAEAFRVLMPGGVAIISTPNKYSLEYSYYKMKKNLKVPAKKIFKLLKLYRPVNKKEDFFQYEFSINELARYANDAGFCITEKAIIGMKFPVYELFKQHRKLGIFRWLRPVIFFLTNMLEKSPLKKYGGLVMVIAYKPAHSVACFFCGSSCRGNGKFRVPVCEKCISTLSPEILRAYSADVVTTFKRENDLDKDHDAACHFCHRDRGIVAFPDDVGNGFFVRVCEQCLKDPLVNLRLANFHIKENWRERVR